MAGGLLGSPLPNGYDDIGFLIPLDKDLSDMPLEWRALRSLEMANSLYKARLSKELDDMIEAASLCDCGD